MIKRNSKGQFVKGHYQGFGFKKGHKHTEEWKQGMSDLKKGKCMGEKRWNWKGGRYVSSGYVWVLAPGHPRASKGYVKEHRLIMEQHIGRYLYPRNHQLYEQVHHKNGIKTDNRIENLEIVGSPHRGRITCPYCNKKFSIK